MIDQTHLGIAFPGTYEVVLDAIRPIRGLNILDIPCRSGGFADQMRTEGAMCIGADIAPPTGHKSVMTADMNKALPFASESFDVITCIEGIEHIHDVFHLLGEYHRVLRPGGRLILSTPIMSASCYNSRQCGPTFYIYCGNINRISFSGAWGYYAPNEHLQKGSTVCAIN